MRPCEDLRRCSATTRPRLNAKCLLCMGQEGRLLVPCSQCLTGAFALSALLVHLLLVPYWCICSQCVVCLSHYVIASVSVFLAAYCLAAYNTQFCSLSLSGSLSHWQPLTVLVNWLSGCRINITTTRDSSVGLTHWHPHQRMALNR